MNHALRRSHLTIATVTALVAALAVGAGSAPGSAAAAAAELVPASVSDSAHDFGHPADLAVDGNADTMWYSAGDPQWLRIDLAEPALLSAVEIAWLDGDRQLAQFHVEISTDRQKWTPVHYGYAGAFTLDPQRYDIDPIATCGVRVVVHGTTNNNWNGIRELRALGTPGTGTCPPPGPSGSPEPPAPTPVGQPAGTDPFGVAEIYRTAPHGQRWFMDMDDADADPRFDPQHPIVRNADGSWSFADPEENDQVRLGVYTTSGYHPERIVTDHGVLAERGYMQDPNDWRNVEMTGYILLKGASTVDQLDWYARGGHHSSPKPYCEGVAYKGDFYYDGRVRGVKEQFHTGGYVFSNSVPAVGDLTGHWVGLKMALFNVRDASEPAVRMQLFIDEHADNHWLKVYERTDRGGWGKEATVCGATHPDQVITWGGPIATFRWDNATDVAWKWLSVREIAAPRGRR